MLVTLSAYFNCISSVRTSRPSATDGPPTNKVVYETEETSIVDVPVEDNYNPFVLSLVWMILILIILTIIQMLTHRKLFKMILKNLTVESEVRLDFSIEIKGCLVRIYSVPCVQYKLYIGDEDGILLNLGL